MLLVDVAARHAGSGANLRSHITRIRLLQARRNCQLVQNHPDLMSLSIREIEVPWKGRMSQMSSQKTPSWNRSIYDKGSALFATCSEQYIKFKKKVVQSSHSGLLWGCAKMLLSLKSPKSTDGWIDVDWTPHQSQANSPQSRPGWTFAIWQPLAFTHFLEMKQTSTNNPRLRIMDGLIVLSL